MSTLPPHRIRTDLIRIKLAEIRDGISIVRANLPPEEAAFLRLGLIKDGIYKKTEYAIENVLDICAVLNSDLMLGVPGDNEDIIAHLQLHQVISDEMGRKIRGMKAFRNIMVHRYGAIDDQIAYRLLNEHLDDFDAFRSAIEKFLSEPSP